MGLFKNFVKGIGNIVTDSAISGLTQGIRQTEMNNRWGLLGGILGNTSFNNGEGEIIGGDDLLFGFNSPANVGQLQSWNTFHAKHSGKFSGAASVIDSTGKYDPNEDGIYKLSLPSWGYNDFINERNIFIKHLSNGFDEPGWFYFKLFFEFNTNHGLLGGILNHAPLSDYTYSENNNLNIRHGKDENTDSDKEQNQKKDPNQPDITGITSDPQPLSFGGENKFNYYGGINTAFDYLVNCNDHYKVYSLLHRAECLAKFVRLLSFINLNAPWFFKGVKNLAAAGNPVINNFNEEKSIEIELNQEAIDMRLTTLLALYKYVCYDDIYNVEILPENLRKFDLCVAIFQSPIKLIHTPIYDNNKRIKGFKQMGGNDTNSYMSFKMYKFMNCEIDITSIGAHIPEINNENPFHLGQNTLKIKYDKVYEYTMNEFMGGFMVGSNGVYLNDNSNIEVMDADLNSSFTTLSEHWIRDHIGNILKGNDHFALGNIYGQDKTLYKEKSNGSIDRTSGLKTNFTDYYIQKTALLSNKLTSNTNPVINTGFDILYKLLGSSYHAGTSLGTTGDGTVLNGHGEHGVGSAVWYAKMDRLMNLTSGQSGREYRITVNNNANNANWSKRLHDLAVNSINGYK